MVYIKNLTQIEYLGGGFYQVSTIYYGKKIERTISCRSHSLEDINILLDKKETLKNKITAQKKLRKSMIYWKIFLEHHLKG